MGFARAIADNEFVGSRAAGVLARDNNQWSVLGNDALTARNGTLVECGRSKVPMDCFQIAKALFFKAVGASPLICHPKPLMVPIRSAAATPDFLAHTQYPTAP